MKFKSVQVNMKHVSYATEQSWCYIKFFKKKKKNVHILYFCCLATNLLDIFINTRLCVTLVTILVKDILQIVWLCTTDCNKDFFIY